MEQRLAIERKAAGGVGHQATALGRADRLAQVGLARQAEFALAAFRRIEWNDVVVFLECRHAGANVDHDARAFVAEDGGEQPFRIGAGQGVVIGMANAGGLQFDQHFARLRAFKVNIVDRQRRAGLPCDCGFGFHACSRNAVSIGVRIGLHCLRKSAGAWRLLALVDAAADDQVFVFF